MTQEHQLDTLLDQTLEEIRAEEMTEPQLTGAAERVWARLQEAQGDAAEPASIRGCDDFQALIPAYLAGRLPAARRLLLEDHSRSCLTCRRALKEARSEPQKAAAVAPREGSGVRTVLRWAAVAVMALGAGIVAWTLLDTISFSWGKNAVLAELDGALYQVSSEGYIPLTPGDEIPYGATIRAAKGAGAILKLDDGSVLELDERSQVQVARRRAGTFIELGRGNIIVEAAPQHGGELFVTTDDCQVAVTGTVFSVNHGTKGSRVSVIEGSVLVGYGSEEARLTPGQQVTTHPSLGPVPVPHEIAWSRKLDDHLALLEELNALQHELYAALADHGLNYSTHQLDLMPATTALYLSLPNVSTDLAEAFPRLRERIEESPLLRDWWEKNMGDQEATLYEMIDRLGTFGEYVGNEISISFGVDAGGEPDDLLLLAEAEDADALEVFLAAQLDGLAGQELDGLELVLVDDPAQAPPEQENQLLLWVHPDYLAIASNPQLLRDLQGRLETATSSPFVGTTFHQRLAEVYIDGVDWLVAADVEPLIQQIDSAGEVLARTGVLDVEHLILERRQGAAGTQVHHRAVLSFDGPRRGVAGWLAEPAPMASLEFVSPDAHWASTVLIGDPEQLVGEIFSFVDPSGDGFLKHLAAIESQLGFSLMEDFAGPLGGELTLAIDGPMLPTPSWKAILEVYEPARLQSSIEWLVQQVNTMIQIGDEKLFALTQEATQGRPVYRLTWNAHDLDVYYTFVDGYLMAGPTRALLDRAVQQRDSGLTLPRSERFTALLPPDGHANFSALVYQDLGSLLGPLAGQLSELAEGLSPDQQGKVTELVSSAPATLAAAYGEEDRIILVSNSESDYLASLLGFGSALSLSDLFEAAASGQVPGSR